MDLETLANIGEFVGGTFVVISLVYLALQIRQNTASQRTQNYAIALDRISELQSRMGSDDELVRVVASGVFDHNQLTPVQRIRFTWTFYEMFGAFEFMFHQAGSGALASPVWQRWSDTLSWWISMPGVQAWWDARPTPFAADFTAHVEALRRHGTHDPGAHERWIAYMSSRNNPPTAGPQPSH